MNYEQANSQLVNRNKVSKKLANNTYLIRNDDNSISVKLHNTNIVTFYQDGKIILTSGGWHTHTTKDRINTYSGYRLSQNLGRWSLYINQKEYSFNDGIEIYPNGQVKNAAKIEPKKDLKFKVQVSAYAKLCAQSIPLDKPDSGDCWYCHMITDDNKSLGDAFKDTEHLESHIHENYVVPSLVYHALKEYNVTDYIMTRVFTKDSKYPISQDAIERIFVQRAVRKYILKRFGFAV